MQASTDLQRIGGNMPNGKRFLPLIAVGAICLTLLPAAIGCSSSTPQNDTKAEMVLDVPDVEDVRRDGYSVNESGMTYGPVPGESNDFPDLILVKNEEGVVGYVRKSDLLGEPPSSPEEALERSGSQEREKIPMYFQDGTTFIAYF